MPRGPAAYRSAARQRGFLDFSFPELSIIFGVALVVLGPKKLPGLVSQIGRWVGRAKFMARQFREQLEQEVNSINAVQPISTPSRAQPAAAPAAQAAKDGTTELVGPPAPGHVEGVAQPFVGESVEQQAAAAEAGEMHPEAQMYFAMNNSQPEIVFSDPLAETADLEPAAEHPGAAAAEAGSPAGAPPAAGAEEPEHAAGSGAEPSVPAATPRPTPAQPTTPASVEVIFPHDHE